tara:strand:+ start:52 stop:270 length:219 start_codon:yes stop_codon:yes gene_type:complete
MDFSQIINHAISAISIISHLLSFRLHDLKYRICKLWFKVATSWLYGKWMTAGVSYADGTKHNLTHEALRIVE